MRLRLSNVKTICNKLSTRSKDLWKYKKISKFYAKDSISRVNHLLRTKEEDQEDLQTTQTTTKLTRREIKLRFRLNSSKKPMPRLKPRLKLKFRQLKPKLQQPQLQVSWLLRNLQLSSRTSILNNLLCSNNSRAVKTNPSLRCNPTFCSSKSKLSKPSSKTTWGSFLKTWFKLVRSTRINTRLLSTVKSHSTL